MDPSAEGRPRQIQPATIHNIHSTSRILEAKGQEQHHLQGEKDPSPDFCTAAPDLASGTGLEHHRGEKEVEHYSSRRRHLRLVVATPECKPQRNIPPAKPSSANDNCRRANPRPSYSMYIRMAPPRATTLSDASPAATDEGGRRNPETVVAPFSSLSTVAEDRDERVERVHLYLSEGA